MKYKFLFGILFIASFVNAQSLFDTSVLHEIRVTSTETDLWDILVNDYQDYYPEVPYESVSVEIDGNTLENVGIRLKGYSSYFFCYTDKKPIKINFGKFVSDQRYDKVKKINLANGVGDPAIVKDKIIYDIYRQHGIPAPRVAHAKIYIQGVYWGIYAIIEQVDKRFLKRNYADKSGNLWKNKDYSELKWHGTNPSSYTFELQTNETENDWTKFIEFVNFINNTTDTDFKNGIENIFDLDEFLRIIAIDILSNNWDSYIANGRNWYLYHEPKTDIIHWIPWDYNFSLDRDESGYNDFQLLLGDPEKVLIKRILQVPEFKERYIDYMCEILAVNFTSDRINPILDAHLDLIDDDWGASNDFFTLTDVQDEINGNTWDGGPVGGPFQGIKKFITERVSVLENEIVTLGHTCPTIDPAINEHDVVINEFMAQNIEDSPWSDQDNEHDDWVELYNNTNDPISLKNYFLSDSPSFIHKWEFPEDASIPAHGYLIIWTDKDPQQTGLHTKFNLDKNGDELILSYIDGTIIDSVDYTEEQADNRSLSRIPNGTGDFMVADVTFNALNANDGAGIESLLNHGIAIYPNPATDSFDIHFNKIPASKISITNSLGQRVYQVINNEKSTNIDISNWKSGIYYIKLVSDNYTLSNKLIVK